MQGKYEVQAMAVTRDCLDVWEFDTEREAREFLNVKADGGRTYTLVDPAGEVIVRSRFPVLMVA
jgi:hypothetical protein